MKKENCFELGYITKTHGLTGGLTIFLDVDKPRIYYDIEAVFIEINNQLIPYFIESIQPTKGNLVLIKFEEVATLGQANSLISKKLFLSLDKLPQLEEGQYYYHELINYTVTDKQYGQLGKVTNVITNQKQDLIVMEYKGKEVLIPVNEDVILLVNKELELINTNLPSGLLEVYIDGFKLF